MNSIYQTALNAALNGGLNAGADTYSVQGVNSGYSPNFAANGDQFFSSVPGGDRLGSKVHLGSLTTLGGILSAANTDLGSTWTGNPTIKALVVFKDTGVDATSQLIAYIDGFQGVETTAATTTGATSIPIIPLTYGIASGVTFTLGGQSVTTSAAYTPGGFSLAVTATGGNIAQGATGQAPILNANLPIPTANTVDVQIAWSSGQVFQL